MNEDFTFQVTRNIDLNAGESHTNVVSVIAVDDEGNPATDDDDNTVTATDVLPAVTVDKSSDGEVLEGGENQVYTIKIANTSAADAVTVTYLDDDKFGNLLPEAEAAFGGTITLGVNEDFTFQVTRELDLDKGESHTNVVTVTVSDDDGNSASASDDDTVVGVAPQLEIEKQIFVGCEWVDADGDAELLKLLATQDTLEYRIVVKNTGTTELTGIKVWDPNLGIEVWQAYEIDKIEAGGQVILGVEEICKLEVCWSEGEVLNTAFADSDQTDVVTDDANYFGVVICLDVDKVTIDAEGNTGDDLVVAAGEAIKWQYTLTNNSNVAIAFSDFTFFDDNGTWDEGDDWPIDLTLYDSGDTNENGLVDPEEKWVFVKEGTAINGDLCDNEGRYSNYAIVSVDYEDDAGLTRTYTALDTSSYTLEGYEGGKPDHDGHPDGEICDDDDGQPGGPPDGEVCDDDDGQPDGPPDGEVCDDDDGQPEGPPDGDFCDEDGHNDDDGQLGGNGHHHGSHDDDHLTGCKDDEWFYGRNGNDWMNGKGGKDHFHGERGHDAVFGGRGGDHIFGGRGKDKLHGEKGKDHIEGGKGHDRMWGGDGCDTFKFSDGDGRDKVFDFDAYGRKHDIIDLSDVSDIGGWKDLKNNHLEEVNKGIWIHSEHVEIFLKGVEWADLDKGDFCL